MTVGCAVSFSLETLYFRRSQDSPFRDISMLGVRVFGWIPFILLFLCSDVSVAYTMPLTQQMDPPMDETTKAWNIPFPTLGGKQFWTDYRWWYGWKVQYNSTLGHWRLLDPKGIRRAWGGKQAMLGELERAKAMAPPSIEYDEVILLAHGLFRTHGSMMPIAEELRRMESVEVDRHATKRICVAMAYASTRDSIDHHSAAMRELLENLPGKPRISFVGHSLGNIVFRHAIGEWQRNGDPEGVLKRLNRAVMLGPPNNGSAFAAQLSKLGLFETLTGSSGVHLGPSWEKLQASLGVPPCPFAIVIGDVSGSAIQNPFLEGPSDGVVTVEEAKLDGATEIKTFPTVHSFLMSNEEIVRSVVSFLVGKGL